MVLEALKEIMKRVYGKEERMPDYMRRWINGEIDFEEFQRHNERVLKERGYIKASGTWWPKRLFDKGALTLVDGQVAVVAEEREIPDPKRPGRTKKTLVLNQEWLKWCEEEERKWSHLAYLGHVTDEYGKEAERWEEEDWSL